MKLPKLPRFRIEVDHYEPVPRCYGVAYRPLDRFVVVCYPIPFNVVYGFLRRVWIWLAIGFYPDLLERAWQKGYTTGREEAKKDLEKNYFRTENDTIRRQRDYIAERLVDLLYKHPPTGDLDGPPAPSDAYTDEQPPA